MGSIHQPQDVISANKDFAVVRNAPGHIAARLRVSEKNFVADHAQSLGLGVGTHNIHPEDSGSNI